MVEKTKKKSFIFNVEWQEILLDYPSEVRLEVYDAIIEYVASGTLTELKPIAKMAFSFIKLELEDSIIITKLPPSRENHWNWKGGITDENHRLRESSKYHQWRNEVFARDKYTCQKCGQTGGVLNAHHIKPFSIYPDLRFDIGNGITLCKKCHIELHRIEREWNKSKHHEK